MRLAKPVSVALAVGSILQSLSKPSSYRELWSTRPEVLREVIRVIAQ